MMVSLFIVSSCHDELHEETAPEAQKIEVGFYAGGAQTRTEMLSNGLSAAWQDGDQLAVWARNSSGAYTLSQQMFKTYGINHQHGYFTSNLNSSMPDDTYTYYCCYPTPISVNGTTAKFYMPVTQDGKVSGGADIMVATPVTHGPLAPMPEVEDHSGLSMTMNRMTHQFRFWIPESDTKIGNAQIKRIILTFPTQIAGDVQVQIDNPSRSMIMPMGGRREITLDLAEPISRQKQNYACVAFVPTKFSQGQSLQIKAYTEDKILEFDPVDLQGKNCLPGHSTPIKLIARNVKEYPHEIGFSVLSNSLGEDINSIRFEAPSGCVWGGTNSNVYTYDPGRKILPGEEIVFRYEDKSQYQAFSRQTIKVIYESDNAVVSEQVTIADLSLALRTYPVLRVPYLFYEDFSSIPTFSDGNDNDAVGQASSLYKGIKELSQYSSLMRGWYATRIGVKGGTAARICCRYEDVLGNSAYYKGRLYTPFLSNLKDGADVNISVSFRYGGDRKEMLGWNFKYPLKSPVLYFGINSQDVVTNPDQNEGDVIDQITGLIGGSGYASMNVTSLSPIAIKGEAIPMGGSYTSFAGTKTVTIENVDNGMRLGWVVTTDSDAGSVNANYWLYIDDIKVQITR